MSEGEVFVLILSLILALLGAGVNSTGGLHSLFFRRNPAVGIVRLSVILAMLWIAYVLWNHADPSVKGIYVFFYLLMGFAVVKLFGQSLAMAFGASTRHDAGERRNMAAAIVIAGLTLSTGMIFGGSLWGEADPVGDEEGGWWIPVTFFLLGWGCLMAVFGLYLRRDKARFSHQLRRERNVPAARAAAAFLISCAVPLTEAVSGDFWGWRHGLSTFGVLALLLIAHEVFASWTGGAASEMDTASDARRIAETVVYLFLGGVAWGLHRLADRVWGPG
ncbi:MAG TPA: hypothetical protein VNA04_15840 [Thermoanaerobaculia bacterium]|nr:hypothetical protein [Thermoanaerobaculia bacterium]